MQVALQAHHQLVVVRRLAQFGQQAVGVVEQVAGLFDEDVDQFQVQFAGVQRLVRVFARARGRLQRGQRRLLARPGGSGNVGSAAFGFRALGLRAARGGTFGLQTLGLRACGGNAFCFDALGLAPGRLFRGDALGFLACRFFRREALGFGLLGRQTRGFGFRRGNAFGLLARRFFRSQTLGFGLLGRDPRSLGCFRGDPLAFETRGLLGRLAFGFLRGKALGLGTGMFLGGGAFGFLARGFFRRQTLGVRLCSDEPRLGPG